LYSDSLERKEKCNLLPKFSIEAIKLSNSLYWFLPSEELSSDSITFQQIWKIERPFPFIFCTFYADFHESDVDIF